jgi:hypothetical protein
MIIPVIPAWIKKSTDYMLRFSSMSGWLTLKNTPVFLIILFGSGF